MKHSQAISDLITDDNVEQFFDHCDSTCTTGYDNDGSTGQEIFENGVELGQAAGNQEIFYGSRDYCAFFFIARKDETEEQIVEQIKAALDDA